MKRLGWLSLVLAVGLVGPAAAQEKTAESVRLENDVVFGKGGEQELKLDLALPDGKGPFPAVLCIHGGGWRDGNRKQFAQTIRLLAEKGYVGVSVQYRLTPKAQFPAQVEDCKCAVRWLRANAGKYRIDPNRVGAMGISAGAHLACMLGLTLPEDGLEGAGGNPKESSRLQAVVSVFGPTDLTKGDWDPAVQPLLTDFLGGTLNENPKAYRRASPIIYVRKEHPAPAFLFFHGTKDNIVRYGQSVRLVEALKAIGGQAELITMEGEGHGWGGEKFKQTIDRLLAFFDQQLKKAK